MNKADVGSSEEAVVTFDGIAILTPRWVNPITIETRLFRNKDIIQCYCFQFSGIANFSFSIQRSIQC